MPIELNKYQLSPLRIAATYAVIGGLWIVFSDRVLSSMMDNPALLTRLQTYKGWGFVSITAVLLFWIIDRYNAKMRHSEAVLTESEERFRRLAENAHDMIYRMSLPDGRYEYVNPASLAIFGYSPEEFYDAPVLVQKLIHPDWHGYFREQWDNLLSGKMPPFYEYQIIHKSGEVKWLHQRNALVTDNEGRPIAIEGVVTDFTERKKTEEALRESEWLLKETGRIAKIGGWEFDPTTLKGIWTDEVARIHDLDPDQKTNVDIGLSYYHGESRNNIEAAVKEAIESGKPYDLELEIISAKGAHKWVRTIGIPIKDGDKIVKVRGSFQDITERKKAEEELRISNEELQSINRIITTTTTTTTTGLKEILEKVMDEALNITGLEGGTICMVTPDDTLQLAAHRATSEATIQDLTTNIVKVGECLCGECARDQKPLILQDRKAVLRFSTREAQRGEDIRFHAAYPLIIGGKCLGVLCVFTRTDRKPAERSLKLIETITNQIAIAVQNAQMYEEIKRHSEILENQVKERTFALQDSQKALTSLVEDLNQRTTELQVANEQLKKVDRLKSLFIASMSHELRTPLNSIIGFSSILLNEWAGPLSDEQKDNLATVLRSGKHLLSLINDVIDVSKIEAGTIDVHAEDFDIHDIIAETAKQFEKDAKDKGLEFTVENLHQPMHADRRRLLQSVMNLVSNAVKFTERGSVRVQARLSAECGVRN